MTEKRKPRIAANLESTGGVLTELTRVYRAARHGDLDTQDAGRLATILVAIRGTIESRELEARLTMVEAALSIDSKRGFRQ